MVNLFVYRRFIIAFQVGGDLSPNSVYKDIHMSIGDQDTFEITHTIEKANASSDDLT